MSDIFLTRAVARFAIVSSAMTAEAQPALANNESNVVDRQSQLWLRAIQHVTDQRTRDIWL